MGRSQREKGKRGERQAAKAVTAALGVAARRGVQYKGGADSADLAVEIPGIHWEVKFVERESVRTWMAQACQESGGQVPVVLHKRSRGEWLVTLQMERLYEFVQRLEEAIDTSLQGVVGEEVPGAVCPEVLPSTPGQASGPARILSDQRRGGPGRDCHRRQRPAGRDD
jgi:hypothetical protein